MVKLYHYTTAENGRNILRSGVIKAQSPHGGTTDMPYGVYLTAMPPSSSTKSLVFNNFDDRERVSRNFEKLAAKTEIAFVFDSEKLPGVYQRKAALKGGRDEWVCPHDIPIERNGELFISDSAVRSDFPHLEPGDRTVSKQF